jgi:hypothetical protein
VLLTTMSVSLAFWAKTGAGIIRAGIAAPRRKNKITEAFFTDIFPKGGKSAKSIFLTNAPGALTGRVAGLFKGCGFPVLFMPEKSF